MAGCPNDDDLSSYLAGRVSEVEAAAIAQHVATCRSCEALVEVLGTAAPLGSGPTVAAPDARPHDSVEARAGDVIGGYVLQQRVGAGGMGVVWQAYDPDLDRTVALKVMRDAGEHLRARFDREVRITARLQHPSIVNIFEAGRWRGEPYYVMKLVRGESLDRQIAARATLPERLALLPAAIAVVDAIAYAHRARVMHRDLKPENVLIGEFGEAVVIDWGLAKAIGEGDVPAASAASDGDETVAGAVIGTPAYMPPEQARGETVDARADVYALGAILYCLLAGTRPYADVTGSIVSAVLSGPPAPLPAAVPPELATIVHKAMARDAAERYPTAMELADELKRFQTGQLVGSHRYTARALLARWIRRHRAATAVGALAIIALGVVGAVSINRISAQRAIAQHRRHEADELLDFMIFDLRDRLKVIGRLDILDAVAQRASTYALADDATSDSSVLYRQQAMLGNLGDVLSSKGDIAGALVAYRKELAAAQQLSRRDPTNRSWHHALTVAQTSVGDALLDLGDAEHALASYRAALAADEQLRAGSDDRRTELDLATDHEKIGDVMLHESKRAEAEAERRKALELTEAVAARHPDDLTVLHSLARAHAKVGATLLDPDPAAAIVQYRAALTTLVALAAKEPGSSELQRDIAGYLNNVAIALSHQGDDRGALAEYRASLPIAERLSASDPMNADLLRDVSATHENIADSLLALHDAEGAVSEYKVALDLAQRLADRDPASDSWQRDLAKNEYKIGAAYLALGRTADVAAHYRAALAVAQRALARDPGNTDWKDTAEQLEKELAPLGSGH